MLEIMTHEHASGNKLIHTQIDIQFACQFYAHRSLVYTSKQSLLKSLFSSWLLFGFIGNNNQEYHLLSRNPDRVKSSTRQN